MVKKISNKTQNMFFVSANAVTVVIDGESYSLASNHQMFNQIKDELKKDIIDWEKVKELCDITQTLRNWSGDNFKVIDGSFYYTKDNVLIKTNPILNRIMAAVYSGESHERFLNFFDKLLSNPTESSREELFLFLQACTLPITSDGDFLAYKVITENYKDKRTQTFDNSIGATVKMSRLEVCGDRSITCSSGLHFCSKDYIRNFSSHGDRLVVIKVNPKDVVSIPDDYNNTKGRCCEYTVVAEIEDWDNSIPELSEGLVERYQQSHQKVEEKVSEENNNDVVVFEGTQKDFFKTWSKPRNNYTTYILKNSGGEQAYKFIGGLGQKCFKKVDMPEVKAEENVEPVVQEETKSDTKNLPVFSTVQEARKKIYNSLGEECIVKDKVYRLQRVKCTDGYYRVKLVKQNKA